MIQDVLLFREDISPFLVHLARNNGSQTAQNTLLSIAQDKKLKCGSDPISDARFGVNTTGMGADEKKELFCAICFTETPLNEVHCLLEIDKRQIHLAPYGLVFLKDNAVRNGVEPVIYINNYLADKNPVIQSLCSLKDQFPEAAALLLPLISVMGKKFTPPGGNPSDDEVDFYWEREWRYVANRGDYPIKNEEIFVGLCPDSEISDFESAFQGIEFIDPMRNMKWYASKLIKARQRLNIKNSVV